MIMIALYYLQNDIYYIAEMAPLYLNALLEYLRTRVTSWFDDFKKELLYLF